MEDRNARRAQRRRQLADRAAAGDTIPSPSSSPKARQLFLHAGPTYHWEDGELTMVFGRAGETLRATYKTAAVTEKELRRLSRAAATAPDLVSAALKAGRASHVHEAVAQAADTLSSSSSDDDGGDNGGGEDLHHTVAVRCKGGRLGPKRPEGPVEE